MTLLHLGVDLVSGAAFRLPAQGHKLVVGPTGSGKSSAILGMIAELRRVDRSSRVVLVDGKGEMAESWTQDLAPVLAHTGSFDLLSIRPWSQVGVPLNLLSAAIGLPPDVHAATATAAIEGLMGVLGPRARPIFEACVRASIEAHGNLLTVLALLEGRDEVRRAVATRCSASSAYFLDEVLPSEPQASISSAAGRLRAVLALDNIRAHLCAPGSLAPRDLLGADMTVVDAATGPLGQESLAAGIGGWVTTLIANGVFARGTGPGLARVVIVLDEFQRMSSAFPAILRLLQQGRAFAVTLILATQTTVGLPADLLASLETNASMIAMMPAPSEVARLRPYLKTTGQRVDAQRPDRLLSDREETALLERELFLARKPREGVYVDREGGGVLHAFRVRDYPFDGVRRRAAEVPQEVRHRVERGRFGVPIRELVAQAVDPFQHHRTSDANAPAPSTTSTPRRGKIRLVTP